MRKRYNSFLADAYSYRSTPPATLLEQRSSSNTLRRKVLRALGLSSFFLLLLIWTIDFKNRTSVNLVEKKDDSDDKLRFQATKSSCASLPTLPSTQETKVIQSNISGTSFSMHLYNGGDIVSDVIGGSGYWELNHISVFSEVFKKYSRNHGIALSDLTFVDIGANVGWFALNLAALGVNVIAFEPMEQNINLLRQSLCLPENIQSGVSKRITLFSHGLGKKEETCIIYSGKFNFGDGHVKCVEKESDLQIPKDHWIRGRIPVRRLDDVISIAEQGMNVVAVKMDVEGYEPNVLEGGTRFFLESDIPFILTEFVPEYMKDKGGDPDEMKRQFASAGYRFSQLNSPETAQFEKIHP